MIYTSDDAYPLVWINDIEMDIHELANRDGLAVDDFVDWFFGSNNKENHFEGIVIHFTKFRY